MVICTQRSELTVKLRYLAGWFPFGWEFPVDVQVERERSESSVEKTKVSIARRSLEWGQVLLSDRVSSSFHCKAELHPNTQHWMARKGGERLCKHPNNCDLPDEKGGREKLKRVQTRLEIVKRVWNFHIPPFHQEGHNFAQDLLKIHQPEFTLDLHPARAAKERPRVVPAEHTAAAQTLYLWSVPPIVFYVENGAGGVDNGLEKWSDIYAPGPGSSKPA